MKVEAVLVSLNIEGSRTSHELSGILFNSNLVLTTGLILNSLTSIPEQKNWITSLLKSTSSSLESNNHFDKASFRIIRELEEENDIDQSKDTKLVSVQSKIIGIWKCPLVAHSLETLFVDWIIRQVNQESGIESIDDIDTSKELMSIFILLKCEGREQDRNKVWKCHEVDGGINGLSKLMLNLGEPDRGQGVEVISTPFGHKIFLNSLSQGVVSNVLGSQKCFILTDARTVSGCEGGPIFAARKSRNENEKLLGLVACSLLSCRGEWVGLTIGFSLKPILKRLLRTHGNYYGPNTIISDNRNSDLKALEMIDETVVLIRSESNWGSGVVLHAASGIIITCSHVINNDKNVNVFYKNKHIPATVVFKSPDNVAYDLAIIQTIPKSVFRKEAKFSCKPAQIGETVIAAGFPFFSEWNDINLRPSLVCGCIARVHPHMIQTTCCIQSGFSGGGLFRNGKLLGIIICNAKDSKDGALFPHINFGVPSTVFQDQVTNFIASNDIQYLKKLESFDSNVQSLWKFQTSKL